MNILIIIYKYIFSAKKKEKKILWSLISKMNFYMRFCVRVCACTGVLVCVLLKTTPGWVTVRRQKGPGHPMPLFPKFPVYFPRMRKTSWLNLWFWAFINIDSLAPPSLIGGGGFLLRISRQRVVLVVVQFFLLNLADKLVKLGASRCSF